VHDRLRSIDWKTWSPIWRATLLFIIRQGHVLLIDKKTGFGQGKVNGPGGRLEGGETPLEAAIREVEEEVRVTPTGIESCGELFFQFQDGHRIHGFVYRADGYVGQPTETFEARPFWRPLVSLPYDRMWADDRYWLPLVVERQPFVARFLFDGETMLDHDVQLQDRP
jgi:8-oxo-dGTP diphosphatase